MSIRIEHRVPAFITGPAAFTSSYLITKKQREGEESQAQYQHDQSMYNRQSSAVGEAVAAPFRTASNLIATQGLLGQKNVNAQALANLQHTNRMEEIGARYRDASGLESLRQQGDIDQQYLRNFGATSDQLAAQGQQWFESNYKAGMPSFAEAAKASGMSDRDFAIIQGVNARQSTAQAADIQDAETKYMIKQGYTKDYTPAQIHQRQQYDSDIAATMARPDLSPVDKRSIVGDLISQRDAIQKGWVQRQSPQIVAQPIQGVPGKFVVPLPGGKFEIMDAPKEGEQKTGAVTYVDGAGFVTYDEKGNVDVLNDPMSNKNVLDMAKMFMEQDPDLKPVDAIRMSYEMGVELTAMTQANMENSAKLKAAEMQQQAEMGKQQQAAAAQKVVQDAEQAARVGKPYEKGTKEYAELEKSMQFLQGFMQEQAQKAVIAEAMEKRRRGMQQQPTPKPEGTTENLTFQSATEELEALNKKHGSYWTAPADAQARIKELTEFIQSKKAG